MNTRADDLHIAALRALAAYDAERLQRVPDDERLYPPDAPAHDAPAHDEADDGD